MKILFISLGLCLNFVFAKVVEHKLVVGSFNNSFPQSLAFNQNIPGPTLKAVVGDTLRVVVINTLDMETSVHWHGVLVPNHMDGVPYVSGPPIKPGETFVYEFPIKHSGTYWYHAHSALQEQQGLYGALVFYPTNKENDYDEEHVLVISDWIDENPDQVLANLKKDPDYYALKKDSVQSWGKVLENGFEAVKIRIQNAWTRMGPMDMSDIGYDAFLINGKKTSHLSYAKPGTRVKFRIINAAASSYFVFEYSGGPMKVIEADGMKVSPFTAQKIRIAMAETYDVIVTIPENRTYELRASAEDGTGYALAHIGQGKLMPAPTYPKPNLAMMDMGGMDHSDMIGMNHGEMAHIGTQDMKSHSNGSMKMDDNHTKQQDKQLPHIAYLNNYKPVKSLNVTTLPKHQPSRVIRLNLTGSMERYVWTVNDTPMYASDEIVIKKGENVKFILNNETMMNHPIHLHGHFFRVLNGHGDYSPLKHTVNVAPFETVEIEFDANEEKDWIFHCHNLYHMKLGMGGTIHYLGTKHDAALMDHSEDHSSEHGNIWFNATTIEGYSNFLNATTKFMRNNDYVVVDFKHNYKKDYEGELVYKKYVTQYLGFYVGGKSERDKKEYKNRGIIGMEYTLPLLIDTDLRIDTKGKVRLGISNEHQLTDRVSFKWKWNTNKDYTLGMSIVLTNQIHICGNYDSKERWGIGLEVKI